MKCKCPNCNTEFDTEAMRVIPPQVANKRFSKILQLVCEHFSVTEEEVLSKDRYKEIVKARHSVMHLAYKFSSLTLHSIGRKMNRDHASVIHANRRVEDSIKTKSDLYPDIIQLERELEAYFYAELA